MESIEIKKYQELLSRAYCPYSNFPVVAVVIGKYGRGIGVNIECHTSKDGHCAEAGAFSSYFKQGYLKEDITALLVFNRSKKFIKPCFLCRQYIIEFMNKTSKIICYNQQLENEEYLVEDLCPLSFSEEDLC